MAPNQIFAKKILGRVVTGSGKQIAISAATKTSYWERPEYAADLLKEPLEKAVVANESVLPVGTVEVCGRESNHANPAGDTRTHITAGTFDINGNFIKTVHLAKPEKK